MMSLPPLRRAPRYRLLDAWRGLACLMVVVHHAGYALGRGEEAGPAAEAWLRGLVVGGLEALALGVALFFVISGYCIAATADATRRRGDSAGSFLARRVHRIFPPYWAALLGFAALVAALDVAGLDRLYRGSYAVRLDPPGALGLSEWVGNLALIETTRPYVWGPEFINVYTGVAWSLCYEWQFYVICFAALALAPRRFFGILAALTALAAAARFGGWAPDLLRRLSAMWLLFAAGVLVYVRLALAATGWARRASEAAVAGLLLVGALEGNLDTVVGAAFGLALIALRPLDDRAAGLGALAPLRACGRRCYSIYLAHLPAVIVANQGLAALGLTGFWARAAVMVPLSSAAALPVCWAFFALVEARFLNPPAWGHGPDARPAPAPPAGEALAPAT